MIRVQWNLVLGAVTFLWMLTLSRGDTDVSCVSMETCILPCSFQVGPDVEIYWIQLRATNLHVHSYHDNQDQLADQDQSFRNRTSLFKDQISRGDASLQLTGVEVQDQGRYRCFTSTMRESKESFINLKVDEPSTVGVIIGGVVGAAAAAAAAVTVLVLLLRQWKLRKQLREQEEQLEQLRKKLSKQLEEQEGQRDQLWKQRDQLSWQLWEQEEQLRKKLRKQQQQQ